MKPLQKFHFNLVTPLILDSPATSPVGLWGVLYCTLNASYGCFEPVESYPDQRSGLFKLHSTVFVFVTEREVGAKIPHRSVLEPEGPTRAHAKSKIVECNLTSPLCLSIPVRTSQALERVQRTTDGPGTPRAPPRCA